MESLDLPGASASLSPGAAPRPAGAEGSLRRLAAALAHTINNALTGVIGNLELARRLTPSGSAAAGHLEASLTCARQAAEAVTRIVAFARRAPGAGELAPLSLRELAEQVAGRLRQESPDDLTVEVVGRGSGWVRANEPLLGAALEQVLRNAVEALPCGGTVSLRLDEENGRALLHVDDTGPGMTGSVLAHLFEPFRTTPPGTWAWGWS